MYTLQAYAVTIDYYKVVCEKACAISIYDSFYLKVTLTAI